MFIYGCLKSVFLKFLCDLGSLKLTLHRYETFAMFVNGKLLESVGDMSLRLKIQD